MVAGIVLMPVLVILNQALVYDASGWRYRLAVASGLTGMLGIPCLFVILALLNPSFNAAFSAPLK